MSASVRHATVAAVLWVLAVVLWWLSRDVVSVWPPDLDPPLGAPIDRTVTDARVLLPAALAAGGAMVFTCLTILRIVPPRGR